MRYARIEGNAIQDVLILDGEAALQTLIHLNAFPENVLFVPCPRGYSAGDIYEAGVFERKDGSEIPAPPPEPTPETTTEDDLMSMAIDHEYRLALLELGGLE
ncbi:MAG: hypothetical protein ACOX0U_04910 [Oscillospiraceae bacterium]|jgi:hypothetical protein